LKSTEVGYSGSHSGRNHSLAGDFEEQAGENAQPLPLIDH